MRFSWDADRKQVVVQVVGGSGAVLNTDLMTKDEYETLRAALDEKFGVRKKAAV
ncbi:MAG: hypothetical protein IT454_20905 [Planctomycetes bacterium]|nr:hypothetical protein [Planctomycetota bacterium]